MELEKEIETKIHATFTKDEWMAIIAAIDMSTEKTLIQHYSSYLNSDMIEKLHETQEALAEGLRTYYGYENSAGTLKFMDGAY